MSGNNKENEDYFEELQDDIRDTHNKIVKLENRLDNMSSSNPNRKKVIRKIAKLEDYLDELNKEMREENNARDGAGREERDE